MKLFPQVSATMPDGTERRWFAGAAGTIREGEAAIRTALALARAASGTDLRIAFIDADSGQCRYRVTLKQ